MMNETHVGWTDLSWNVFSGCKEESTGCAFCYARQLAEQRRGTPGFPFGFDLTIRPKNFDDPPRALKKHGPSLIFVESMSDVGLDDDELKPDEIDRMYEAGFNGLDDVRDKLFDAMEHTPEHRYQLVTKRAKRLLRYLRERGRRVPPSCWVGATVEHPSEVRRLDDLRAFRELGAVVLFVSAEPLVGDVASALGPDGFAGIDWVIPGGESGLHASIPKHLERRFLVERWHGAGWEPRPDRVPWVRRLVEAAHAAGASVWFKQWGGPRPDSTGRTLDGRTYDELPDHVPGAMPPGRRIAGGAPTAAVARKRLPLAPP